MEPLISKFVEDIDSVITKYCGVEITVAEAVGALAIVQAKMIRDALESDDEANQ